MIGKNFPLIPVSLLIEDDSDSLGALVRRAKAEPKPKTAKPKTQGKSATSNQSGALSQLVKVFKAKKSTDKGPDSAATADTKSKDKGPVPNANVLSKSTGADGPSAIAKAKLPAVSAAPAMKFKDPHTDVDHPPGKHVAFEHEAPSLRERTRPKMIPFDERHEDFHERYHSKDASLKEINHLYGSANRVFRGNMDDDTDYIMKPHEGAAGGAHGAWAPAEWGKRHNAVARLLSHMGADHMISPAIDSKAHGSHMIPDGHPSAQDEGQHSAHHHAGKDAFVTEFMPNTVTTGKAESHQHDSVDGEHRLIGMITHLVTHNSDGHPGNVLIDKEHGHPILIDQDLAMGLGVRRGEVRSVFAPGGILDYQAKVGQIGKKYPPRVKKTLEWLAGGGHFHKEMGLDVQKEDGNVMQKMAKVMLDHGLEKAMRAIRHLRPG